MTVLRPFFRHYGSKWWLSRLVPAPQQSIIVEPFAGSAGYSCRYGADREVRLYDVDAGVVAIWAWLIGASRADVLDLPGNIGAQDVRTLDVPEPARLLIQRWLTPQGSTNNYRMPPSALAYIERNPGCYWTPRTRARIADHLDAIRGWTIEQRSFASVQNVQATWSVDPEYQQNARGRAAYGSHAALDYVQLAAWCRTRRGQVIVHEQHGADWLPFSVLCKNARTGRVDNGSIKCSIESIWLHQSEAQQLPLWGDP